MFEPKRDLSIAPCILTHIQIATRGARERISKKAMILRNLSFKVYVGIKKSKNTLLGVWNRYLKLHPLKKVTSGHE